MKKILVIGLAAVIGICGLVACAGDNDTPKKVNTNTTSKTETVTTTEEITESKTEFTINDTIEVDGITYSFDRLDGLTGDTYGFNTKEGFEVIHIVTSVSNATDKDFSTGTIKCYADNVKCEELYAASTVEPRLEGIDGGWTEVGAARESKFFCSFYIPSGTKNIELEMDNGLVSFDDEKIIIKVQ